MNELFCPVMKARQHVLQRLGLRELCQVVPGTESLQLSIPLQQVGCVAQVATLGEVPARKVLPVPGYALCQLAVVVKPLDQREQVLQQSRNLWSTPLQLHSSNHGHGAEVISLTDPKGQGNSNPSVAPDIPFACMGTGRRAWDVAPFWSQPPPI